MLITQKGASRQLSKNAVFSNKRLVFFDIMDYDKKIKVVQEND
jgi:hypothetical protein